MKNTLKKINKNISRKNLFILNSGIATITAIIIQSINMLFNIYLTRKIGAGGSGTLSLIMSIYLFAITLANSGIALSSTKIVAEEVEKKDSTNIRRAVNICLKYSLFMSIIASIIFVIIAAPMCKFLLKSTVSPAVIYIIVVSLPFNSTSGVFIGYFSGTRKVSKISLAQFFTIFVRIVTTIILFSTFKNSLSMYTFIILITANTLAEVLSDIYCYVLYKKEIKKETLNDSLMAISNDFFKKKQSDFKNNTNNNLKLPKDKKEDRRIFKRMIHIAFPIAITSYIRSGLSSLKQMLIPLRLEKFSSYSAAITEYGLIHGMAFPVLMFPAVVITSFAGLLIPEFTAFKENGEYKKINRLITKLFNILSFLCILIIAIFVNYSNELSLFIYNNLNAQKYILILCPLIFFIYLDSIVDSMLKGLDKQVAVMLCNIFDLFTSTFLIYFLLPKYGIRAYICIMYLSELLNFSISVLQLYTETKFKLDIVQSIIVPITSAIISAYILLNLSYTYIILKVCLFILCYVSITLIFSLIHYIIKKNYALVYIKR